MQTRDNELAATHRDGRKLYAPLWDKDGEIIPSALPLAAVSINQDGSTFPDGSFWLRNEFNRLKAGWTLAKAYEYTPSNPRQLRGKNREVATGSTNGPILAPGAMAIQNVPITQKEVSLG
jgi:hypothetical protein